MTKILYVVAVIIGFASTAYAISCNVCNSSTEADCGDPFLAGKTYATDCNTLDNPMKMFGFPDSMMKEASGCFKLKIESSGKEYTSRECYWGDVTLDCTPSGKQGPLKQMTCGVCTTDLCNSSTSTGIFAATVMFLVVLVRMLS